MKNLNRTYRDLGSYSDWVRDIDRAQPLYPMAPSGIRTRRKVRAVLGFHSGREFPRDICTDYHEMTVAKYCALLGVPLAGIVAHEDRIAANYLASRTDVRSSRIGCVGLSGGGMRSGLLQASCNRIRAAVVVGAMTTSEGLLDHNVTCHTWMLFPDGWARHGDWSDLVACRAPSPLLVQYDRDDPLYTPAGMRAADRRLKVHYQQAGKRSNYRGEFYPGLHKFDRTMQRHAFDWLKTQLT